MDQYQHLHLHKLIQALCVRKQMPGPVAGAQRDLLSHISNSSTCEGAPYSSQYAITFGIKHLNLRKKGKSSFNSHRFSVSADAGYSSHDVLLSREIFAQESFAEEHHFGFHESPLCFGSAWGLQPLHDGFKAQSKLQTDLEARNIHSVALSHTKLIHPTFYCFPVHT